MTDSRLTPGLEADYLATGGWTEVALTDLLERAVREQPETLAAVTVGPESVEPTSSMTYAELSRRADEVADGLARLGVAPGDGVAVALPNSAEFAACIWGILRRGAVYTGIPVAYGERETEVILRRAAAKAIFVPTGYRGVEHVATLRRLRAGLPDLAHVVVVGGAAGLGTGEMSYEAFLGASRADRGAVAPGALCHVGFTSGTTGEPKGVMNSHRTLEAVMRGFVDHLGAQTFGRPFVNLVASPVGHHTGFLWGVLLTARLGGTAVFLERWSPRHAADVIEAHAVTTLFGAPTFLQDLVEQREHHGRLSSLGLVVVAGAPVPDGLPAAAAEAFGCWVCPAWGMTEWGIGISRAPGLEARGDGRPLHACDVAILDADGHAVPSGAVGRLVMRGPGLFLGYKDRPDAIAESFDAEGYFDTGDLAVMDDEGYVALRGRTKDIVIRGGENIPVVEIESLVLEHPDVVEAAVVGAPDPRLGERIAAIVVARDGARPGVDDLASFLVARGLSKHYLPEFVHIVDEMPKTASGKIRKNELRGRLADGALAG